MRHSAVSHAGLGSFLLGPTPSCFIAIHQLRAIWSDGHKFTWNTKLLILIAYIVSRHGALSILRDRDVQIQNNLHAIQVGDYKISPFLLSPERQNKKAYADP